jgi:hypothetical protein
MSITGHPSPSLLRRGATLLGVALLVGASVATAASGAAAAPTCNGAPVLDLANPGPGAVLSAGDYVVSGIARDPNATTGDGIDRVELFVGARDAGGLEIGSGTTQQGSFVITAKLPTNLSGGNNFVAYAHSSITGAETSVTVPVFLGAAPTPTPRPEHELAPLELTSSTQSTAVQCAPSPAASTTAPVAVSPSSASTAPSAASAAAVFSLANPGAGDVLGNGDVVVSGTAGTGFDHVDFFLGSRNEGGTHVGSAVPGTGSFNASNGGFSATLTIPTRFSGGNVLYAYAINSTTGQESVVSVPVYVGIAPTPTPRPTDGL